MTPLEETVGYAFRDPQLLSRALSHSSYYNENRKQVSASNERLEFLGDSVLGFLTAEHLYKTHPEMAEGDLTRRRAALVCENHLAEVAEALSLSEHLLLGRGERASGGHKRPSILSDALEALIAAIFLDGGIRAARRFVSAFVLAHAPAQQIDYKTVLQEFLQRDPANEYGYRLTDVAGPDHARAYTVEVALKGEKVGEGRGRSKKEAEQMAARAALDRLCPEEIG